MEIQYRKHMTNYFIIPGYQGSGPDHWQTWIETTQPNFHRVQQRDWDNPDISEWAANIDKAIEGYDPESVVLVAHSLGCLTVAEWVKTYNCPVKAALLVAPPDVDVIRRKVDNDLLKETPTQRMPFRTTLVASSNDPWISIEKAKYYAQNWGSEFINIGAAGHINNLSGYGVWEQGLEILKKLG
jgi:predicted alpha/beta hydrolase family esterase